MFFVLTMLELVYIVTLFSYGFSVLGFNEEVLDSTASLEMHLYAILLQMFLQLSLKPLMYDTTM